MTEDRSEFLASLRREYEEGRISADAYIAAGGDPDAVRAKAEADAQAQALADEMAAAKKAEADRSYKRGCMAIGIAAVVLIGGCVAFWPDNKPTPESAASTVKYVCEKSVKGQLKDPDSASFTWASMDSDSDPDASYFIYEGAGTVRAKNSFGGMVVQPFTCSGTYNVGPDTATANAVLS